MPIFLVAITKKQLIYDTIGPVKLQRREKI